MNSKLNKREREVSRMIPRLYLSNWRIEIGKTEKRVDLGQELGSQNTLLEKLGLRCMLDINGRCHLKIWIYDCKQGEKLGLKIKISLEVMSV